MFPSASNISSSFDKPTQDVNWLTNSSYQVPFETLSDDESVKASYSENDITTEVKAQKDIECKTKRKKKKKSRDYSVSRSRSRSRSRKKRTRDNSNQRRRRHQSSDQCKNVSERKSRRSSSERDRQPKEISSKEKNQIAFSSKKVFLEETGLPPDKAYREDTKSDPNNLAFNNVYNLLVPSYDKKRTIKSLKLREVLRKDNKNSGRYFQGEFASEEEIKILLPEGKGRIELPEYIPLFESVYKIVEQKPREIGDSIKSLYDPVTVLYIKGKDPNKEDAISGHNTKLMLTTSQDEKGLKDQTKEFNEFLRSNPHDIEAWIKFLSFQETSFIWTASFNCSKSRETVLAEKKLAIIDKAIELNPKCMRLILERLNIMQFTATPAELDKEWKRLTFNHPNNPMIWKNYFIFLQTHLSYFSVSKLSKAFGKLFDIFNTMLEGSFETHKPPPKLELEILGMLFHFTTVLSQSGFPEKSLAIWQALIEFNCYTPNGLTLNNSLSEWIALFEPFWDSGCSRFGETGSLGWNKVIATQSLVQGFSRSPIDDLEEPLFDQYPDNKERLWFEIENLREKYYWLPVKGPDADQADDIERNVLFEDITRTLFRFRKEETKFQMIIYFLKFIGAIDSSDLLDNLFITVDSQIIGSTSSYFNLRPSCDFVDFTQFQDQVFQQSIRLFKDQNERKIILARIEFLISKVGHFLEYKKVKRIIKDYLKIEVNRNDLDFWSQLVKLEITKGDYKEAVTIYQTTIKLLSGQVNSRRLLQIVRDYCEFLLGLADYHSVDLSFKGSALKESANQAIKAIFTVCFGQQVESISSTMFLKCFKILSTMAQIHDEFTLDIFFCWSILNFLSNGPDSAYSLCETELQSNQSNDYKEKIFSIYLQLHILDLKINFKPMSRIRSLLYRALNQFPLNNFFLSLFVNLESKIAIPIAVNRFFAEHLRKTESTNLILWMFNLHFELQRLNIMKDSSESNQAGEGIVRRINSIFERCLSFPSNQGIIVLWRLYAQFNLSQGDHKKAESIVYRSLQHCPWAKIIYLDAIYSFPNLTKNLIDIMAEKEIRLRTPLEEIDLLMKNRLDTLTEPMIRPNQTNDDDNKVNLTDAEEEIQMNT